MINPYAILAALLLWIATAAGSFFWGRHVEGNARDAAAKTAGDKVERAEDKRDANVDAIGAAVAAGVAAALNENGSSTHESAERIRTVFVPSSCRDVDPVVVRELAQATDDANTTLRVGLRSAASRAAAGNPSDAP